MRVAEGPSQRIWKVDPALGVGMEFDNREAVARSACRRNGFADDSAKTQVGNRRGRGDQALRSVGPPDGGRRCPARRTVSQSGGARRQV